MQTTRQIRSLLVLTAVGLSGPAFAEPPEVSLSLTPDWVVMTHDDHQIVLRSRDSADGVRINVRRTPEGRLPGISPITGGRTWEVRTGDAVVPTFRAPLTDRPPDRVLIEAQGPDLLIRFEGIPLSALIEHPDAPDDPTLSWVRLRPRPGSWRFILQGLHVWTLSAERFDITARGDTQIWASDWGQFAVNGLPSATRSQVAAGIWWIDTTPSADARDPYPRWSITWTRPTAPEAPRRTTSEPHTP